MHEGFEIPEKSDVGYLNAWLLKFAYFKGTRTLSTSTFEKFQSVLREIFLRFQNTN